jgi:hypothetical protein
MFDVKVYILFYFIIENKFADFIDRSLIFLPDPDPLDWLKLMSVDF